MVPIIGFIENTLFDLATEYSPSYSYYSLLLPENELGVTTSRTTNIQADKQTWPTY
jgi:hypothetical protein